MKEGAPTTKRTTKKVVQPTFEPLKAPDGSKEILSAENQIRFYNMFVGLSPEQRTAVVAVLNAISTAPMLDDGYRKFFRFWRVFGPQINADNITL